MRRTGWFHAPAGSQIIQNLAGVAGALMPFGSDMTPTALPKHQPTIRPPLTQQAIPSHPGRTGQPIRKKPGRKPDGGREGT